MTATAKPAKPPKAVKPPLSEAEAEMQQLLDGIIAVTKKVAAGPARDAALDPLRAQFNEKLTAYGRPVGRSNTVYVPTSDGVIEVDITPGRLVRI